MTESVDDATQPGEGDSEPVDPNFTVHLRMEVSAPDAAQAVLAFIEGLTQEGLRRWMYIVEEEGGDVVGAFTGFGADITDEWLDTDGSPERLPDSDAEPSDPVSGGGEASEDQDLLDLATQLNADHTSDS